ncbi:hypothetical protein N656DRAFT_785544 [Canariomyces notabilis]|uniref:Uncharacterized protein n=1 Tax=Canariomyces notabilis TaxID=2074819 RepID=A0AAN6T7L9_9PEZI|nr:hypothetical protein N656DRAFT_785544 [Canariomyces arenarius]
MACAHSGAWRSKEAVEMGSSPTGGRDPGHATRREGVDRRRRTGGAREAAGRLGDRTAAAKGT